MKSDELSHGEKSKLKILEAAVVIWRSDPLSVTSGAVAARVEMTHANILYHFKENSLREETAKYAIEIGDSRVIAQLIATRHPLIRRKDTRWKRKHLLKALGD